MTINCWALIVLCVLGINTSANAAWERTSETDIFAQYVDRSTIRKAGSFVKMWILTDFRTVQTAPNGKRFFATKMQDEYDCQGMMRRQGYSVNYSGHMGKGENVGTRKFLNDEWEPIIPDSAGETRWKIACKKK